MQRHGNAISAASAPLLLLGTDGSEVVDFHTHSFCKVPRINSFIATQSNLSLRYPQAGRKLSLNPGC